MFLSGCAASPGIAATACEGFNDAIDTFDAVSGGPDRGDAYLAGAAGTFTNDLGAVVDEANSHGEALAGLPEPEKDAVLSIARGSASIALAVSMYQLGSSNAGALWAAVRDTADTVSEACAAANAPIKVLL